MEPAVTSPRRNALRAGVVWLVALGPFALSLALRGVRPLAYDGDWLQHFEALLFLWIAVELHRAAFLDAWPRHLLSAAAVWLAVDERLMVHECMHWKWPLPMVRDPLVLLYALGGIAAALWVFRRHPNRRTMLVHACVAIGAVVLVVLIDEGVVRGVRLDASLVLEEGSEFVAIAAALAIVRAGPRLRAMPAVAWVLFSIVWMGAAVWCIRPWLCPARLLSARSHGDPPASSTWVNPPPRGMALMIQEDDDACVPE